MAIEVNAKKRELQGSSASRRLRHAGEVPGIIYGAGKEPTMITLDHNEIYHSLRREVFHSSVLTIKVDGSKAEQVLLRDVQMHAFKPLVQHVDFQRVDPKQKIHMKVPLHFINADIAPGVKMSHSSVTHVATEVDVSCLPKDLPEFITVDLANLEAGHTIHLSQLTLPKGVECVELAHGNDCAVVLIPAPRGGASAADAS